jgi:intein-encoded DNA endonuclease-like protein
MISKKEQTRFNLVARNKSLQGREWAKRPHKPHFKDVISYPLSEAYCYIAGVMVGDGCAYRSTAYFIRLDVMDKDFAEEFQKQIKILEPNCSPCLYQTKRGSWISAAGYKSLFFAYKYLDIKPIINEATSKEKASFVKGFFDSEGTVYSKDPRAIYAYNTNFELLTQVQKLLSDIGIESHFHVYKKLKAIHYKRQAFLGIYGQKNLRSYLDLIGFSIQRKQERLIQLTNSYITKSYNLPTYQKAIELDKLGKTVNQIAELIKVNRGTIYSWVKDRSTPRGINMGEIKCL